MKNRPIQARLLLRRLASGWVAGESCRLMWQVPASDITCLAGDPCATTSAPTCRTMPGWVSHWCFDNPHMQELKAWSSFIHLTHRQASYHMSVLTECLLYPFKNLSLSAILLRVTEKHAAFR